MAEVLTGGLRVTALNLTYLITAPKTGATPQTAFNGNDQYTGGIVWYASTGSVTEPPVPLPEPASPERSRRVEGNFAVSTVYTVVVTLTAKDGYTFTGVSANAFTYNGASSVTNAADNGIVTITFPPTEAISVDLVSVTADSSTRSTTAKLTLTFSGEIANLSADDITLTANNTGVAKGALTKTGAAEYELALTGISASGQVGVSVAKDGYNINGGDKTVNVHYAVPITLNSVTANGSAQATTTKLTLTFSGEIVDLTAGDITLTAAYCSSLTNLTILEGVASIGYQAFFRCSGLTSVTIGSGVTSFGKWTFSACSELASVTFVTGSNITDANFGDDAFPEGSFGNSNALRTTYQNANPHSGTYTRTMDGDVWTKQ